MVIEVKEHGFEAVGIENVFFVSWAKLGKEGDV